jgi:uncharacterized protein
MEMSEMRMAENDFVQKLMETFGFEPLKVEGGQFLQTYKSQEQIPSSCLPSRYDGVSHPAGTAILYLYTDDPDSFSAVHRLPTDEIYHFYLGDPVEMLLLYRDGTSERVVLGQDILNGQKVQFVAPRGVWQCSHLLPGGKYALAGTTMAPGFEDGDYEGGEREDMIRQYPQEADLIRQLTRPGSRLTMIE